VASVSSPILVGRDAELARLLDAVEVAATGRPQLVVISGEAGIGKSRLLTELVARCRAGGSQILAGGSLDIGDAGMPYLPLAEALRGLARTTPPDELASLLGPTRDDLATIAPELAPAGAHMVERPDVTSTGQARLFERVLELIGRLGETRPTIVVLEDAHWIDRATRDLVTFLVRNVTTERVAAFLSVRTEDLPSGHPSLAWLAELERAPGGMRMSLDPLDRDGIVDQLTAIAGDAPDPDILDRIWSRSEGNPFFAEELFAATAGDGRSDRMTGGESSTLIEILRGRLRGLTSGTHEVVRAAAIAGREVDERLLAAVLDRPIGDVRASLHEAIERHVLVEEPSGALRLRHALLRDVVDRGLLSGERRDLHARFAETLSADASLADPNPAASAGELAHHWAAADRIAEAYEAAIAAAAAADAIHAYADAHTEYERAIDLEARLPAGQRPAAADLDLRRRAAEAADLAGALPRATVLTNEALALADPADRETRGLLHSRLGYLLWAGGDAEAGVAAHRTAVELVPHDPPSSARARVLGGLAGSLMGPGGYDESAALAAAAIACARTAGAVAEEARARNVLGFDLVAMGDVDAGLDELRRSRELAVQGGPPDMIVVAHYNLALNLAEAGRLEDALDEALAGREAGRRYGLDRRFGFDLAALAGDVLIRLGRWAEADRVTSEALGLDRRGLGSAFLSAVRGRLEALRGDLERASRRFEKADTIGAAEDPDLAAYVGAGRAEIALARDQPLAALEVVERALASEEASHSLFVRVPLLALGLRAAADLSARARAARQDALAAEIVARVARLQTALDDAARRVSAVPTIALVEMARAEGGRLDPQAPDRASRSSGPADAAAQRWIALAAQFEELGDRFHAAYARWRAGEAELQARGTRGEAEPLLRSAHEAAVELGAAPLAGEIAALARRARVSLDAPVVPPAPESPPAAPDAAAPEARGGATALRQAGLSQREIEVLRLVAGGRTNGQIAERLFITRKTAGVHVTHILDKLGVTNRVEAAMVAARVGLSPDEEGEP